MKGQPGDLRGPRPEGLIQKRPGPGRSRGFTGIDAPYEEPQNPEITLDSDGKDVDALAGEVIAHLESHGYLSKA